MGEATNFLELLDPASFIVEAPELQVSARLAHLKSMQTELGKPHAGKFAGALVECLTRSKEHGAALLLRASSRFEGVLKNQEGKSGSFQSWQSKSDCCPRANLSKTSLIQQSAQYMLDAQKLIKIPAMSSSSRP